MSLSKTEELGKELLEILARSRKEFRPSSEKEINFLARELSFKVKEKSEQIIELIDIEKASEFERDLHSMATQALEIAQNYIKNFCN